MSLSVMPRRVFTASIAAPPASLTAWTAWTAWTAQEVPDPDYDEDEDDEAEDEDEGEDEDDDEESEETWWVRPSTTALKRSPAKSQPHAAPA